MRSSFTGRALVATGLAVCGLGAFTPCPAGITWFDESDGGAGYDNFLLLSACHDEFIGEPDGLITFGDLPAGTMLSDQYAKAFGVTFQNTAQGKRASQSTIQPEGGATVGNLTGYDYSYMPGGDNVFIKFDNYQKKSPFTILFDDPVTVVGAFVAMGTAGKTHTLTVTAYDRNNQLLASHTVNSWLWESTTAQQNYESFFGLRMDEPLISRVEILNDSSKDYANALILDNLAFGRPAVVPPSVPEPSTIAILLSGGLLFVGPWRKR
jgi:hypothetical protein